MTTRARLIAAVLIVLLAGAAIAGYLVATDDDDDADDDAALGPTTTAGLITTTTAADTTTSTTAPASTTTTTTAATTTTTAAGSTTTTRPPTGVCGTGTARVTIAAKDLTTTPTESAFVPEARVENAINRPIEVEALAADITYPDGAVRRVTFPTAGVVINPDATSTFTAERLATPTQYTGAKVVAFTYFTSGQRDRCRVSL